MSYYTFQEAKAAWDADKALNADFGALAPNVVSYTPDEFKRDYTLAMDAAPVIQTTANAGVPAFLTTLIDPEVYKVLFAPNNGAKILGEARKGTWLDETAMFPTVEHTGEITSYGDFNESGHTGANPSFPQRQSYLFQTIKEYGERELERAGLARISWVGELDAAAALAMNKASNVSYFFGVLGLQNYGLLNDPGLSASITPATKSAGGTKWILNGAINASANEVYADIESIFIQLMGQTGGLIDREVKMVLAMSPNSSVAMTATNTFGINVYDLLKKNFPNIRFETAVQYGVSSATNPQGVAAGNLVQLIVEEVEGQRTGYAAFNEKMRAHKIIPAVSSFKQKVTGGTWGAVLRQPFAVASMIGV